MLQGFARFFAPNIQTEPLFVQGATMTSGCHLTRLLCENHPPQVSTKHLNSSWRCAWCGCKESESKGAGAQLTRVASRHSHSHALICAPLVHFILHCCWRGRGVGWNVGWEACWVHPLALQAVWQLARSSRTRSSKVLTPIRTI